MASFAFVHRFPFIWTLIRARRHCGPCCRPSYSGCCAGFLALVQSFAPLPFPSGSFAQRRVRLSLVSGCAGCLRRVFVAFSSSVSGCPRRPLNMMNSSQSHSSSTYLSVSSDRYALSANTALSVSSMRSWNTLLSCTLALVVTLPMINLLLASTFAWFLSPK